jgi:methylated-DNA-[protein]-cysteine S-methyltransferase
MKTVHAEQSQATPSQARTRSRSRALPEAWCSVDSPLGEMWLAATEHGLTGLWFMGQRHGPTPEDTAAWPARTQPQGPGATTRAPRAMPAAQALLLEAQQQLQRYWTQGQAFDAQRLPLDWRQGTAFQRQVWRALLDIEPGQTSSYGELAGRLGQPQAARAVGAAVGRNPWSLLVPCHRVLGQGGALTGYAGGLERKRWLLRHEGSAQVPLALLTPSSSASPTTRARPDTLAEVLA